MNVRNNILCCFNLFLLYMYRYSSEHNDKKSEQDIASKSYSTLTLSFTELPLEVACLTSNLLTRLDHRPLGKVKTEVRLAILTISTLLVSLVN